MSHPSVLIPLAGLVLIAMLIHPSAAFDNSAIAEESECCGPDPNPKLAADAAPLAVVYQAILTLRRDLARGTEADPADSRIPKDIERRFRFPVPGPYHSEPHAHAIGVYSQSTANTPISGLSSGLVRRPATTATASTDFCPRPDHTLHPFSLYPSAFSLY